MATVQLLLSDEANRDALSSLVGERHRTVTDVAVRDADLYVVDDSSFSRYREELARRKRDLDPVFCPVVLIRRDRSPVSVTLPDIDDSDRPLIVNEVVRSPVDRQAFFRSLSNLLVRRSQTEELAGDLRARSAALRRFENAVEHAGLAIFITDSEGHIEYANPAFEEMTGYTADEAVGRTPRILNSGEQDETFYDRLWETIKAGDVWSDEIVNERKSGERFIATQTISPIEADDGEIRGYVGIQEEITDRRLREQQLAVFHRILRHNLRNNGTTIVGRVEVLEDALGDTLDDVAAEHLDVIRDSMASLLDISEKASRIQHLLANSLAESGTESELLAAVSDVVDDVTASNPDAAITVEATPSESLAVDAKAIPAVREFVDNAVTHSDATTPRVAIHLSADETTATVTIVDNGPGIPDRERRVIQEGTEKPLEHGSGLGLWFAYWLISHVGGDIDIRADRSGTTVSVTIPVR
ncbi:PAS domain-containing sensor histidine kinase [Haloarcula onubensis]|uniref:histidine kinase n=1 Tax=Haloarcula onubensis TaxID=2950539 RepID=A0ABU2FR79_9EURY|nr:PAS domain S-box protein [Halomicroarcula sp. S3CR25-11]MDS0283268.1 PAS domain S-box protein [Halomicroarcula sp. S3CR25-11]